MQTPFLLSHHYERDFGRCVRVFGLHLCARCLGLYPTLLAVIGVQIAVRAPLELPGDWWAAFLLPLPAMVDWARGRFDPTTGTTLTRMGSGLLLGIGLGRTLYLHMRRPGFALTMAQLGVLLAIFLVVEILVRIRRARSDPKGTSGV
jgi:uncharacterized membrane protein